MCTQSFDVNLCDKDMLWGSEARREWSSKKALRLEAQVPSMPAEPCSESKERTRWALNVQCQGCSLAALVTLAGLHTLVLYEQAANVISVYVIIIVPLLSAFYAVAPWSQVHLYLLHVSAVVVLILNVRFKRDFSLALPVVSAVVLLHAALCGNTLRRRDESGSELRARAAVAAVLAVNVAGVLLLSMHDQRGEYSPLRHGAQAMLLLLNFAAYAHTYM